jgi:integrase
LRQREAPAARALEFLILSATRGGETRGARWAEIDLEKAVWTIPAARMKSKRPHRVPITARMAEILAAAQREAAGGLVFPGPGGENPLSDSAFKVLLDRMGFGSVTPHGFRSAFRDWASESTSFAHQVAEMALAHVIADKTEAAYRRGDLMDKRRALMNAWDTFATSKSAEPPSARLIMKRPESHAEGAST